MTMKEGRNFYRGGVWSRKNKCRR